MKSEGWEAAELKHAFSVGQWQVDALGNTLSRDGAIMHLEPKVIWVLKTLADRPGDIVTRKTLYDEVWRGRPVGDEVLSRCISLLRGALGDDPKHPDYIQTIPGVGYRLVAQVAVPDAEPATTGLITEKSAGMEKVAEIPAAESLAVRNGWLRLGPRFAALVVATGFWIIQGSGAFHADTAPHWLMSMISTLMVISCSAWVADVWLHMTQPGDGSQFLGPLLRVNRIDFAFMALALTTLAFALVAVPGAMNGSLPHALSPELSPGNTIAVLPFRSVSATPDMDYFSQGLTDELATRLSQAGGLKVVARTTSSALDDSAEDARAVGRRLGASKLVSGTVRVDGRKLRISVQLVDAGDGYELWADSYDATLDEVFVVQNKIAISIVNAVAPQLNSWADETIGANGSSTGSQGLRGQW